MIGVNGFRGVRQYAQCLFSLFKLNVAVSDTLLDLCAVICTSPRLPPPSLSHALSVEDVG